MPALRALRSPPVAPPPRRPAAPLAALAALRLGRAAPRPRSLVAAAFMENLKRLEGGFSRIGQMGVRYKIDGLAGMTGDEAARSQGPSLHDGRPLHTAGRAPRHSSAAPAGGCAGGQRVRGGQRASGAKDTEGLPGRIPRNLWA